MLTAVCEKNTVSFIIVFGTISFPIIALIRIFKFHKVVQKHKARWKISQ